MAVVKEAFDVTLIPQHVFENKRSYEAAVYAIELLNKLLKYQKEGWITIDEGIMQEPVFDIDYDDEDFQVSAMTDDGRVIFIGDVHGGPNCDKVYLTKKIVREWFNRYRFIRKANVKNLMGV